MSGESTEEKQKSGELTRAAIEHIATLSALSLSADEADKLTRELGAIVGYIAELDELDTSEVPPTAVILGSGAKNAAWRSDEVQPSVDRAEALAQAPRSGSDGFLVPGFVDSGTDNASARGGSK